jgi:hypothetical protein
MKSIKDIYSNAGINISVMKPFFLPMAQNSQSSLYEEYKVIDLQDNLT